METNTDKIIAKLHALVQKNRDAEKGFAKAAEIATAKSLASWFKIRARERKMFMEELEVEAASFGPKKEVSGSLSANLHRTWMVIKATFSGDNDEVMLEEAMRGEKAALDEYNGALGEVSLPPTTEVLLKAHRAKIEHGLALLRTLDDIKFQEES